MGCGGGMLGCWDAVDCVGMIRYGMEYCWDDMGSVRKWDGGTDM